MNAVKCDDQHLVLLKILLFFCRTANRVVRLRSDRCGADILRHVGNDVSHQGRLLYDGRTGVKAVLQMERRRQIRPSNRRQSP